MKAVVAAFNQEKALVEAFSVIVQPVVEPMDRFAALVYIRQHPEALFKIKSCPHCLLPQAQRPAQQVCHQDGTRV